jgi:hypothetical protein
MTRPTILPDAALQCVDPAIRKTMGKAGKTAAECREIAVAKSERELQGQIQNLLLLNGVKFPVRQRMDRKSNLTIGCPDFLFCHAGTAHAWEIKMPGEKPRPEQVKAMAEMTADGWRCAVVTSIDQALAILRVTLPETHHAAD